MTNLKEVWLRPNKDGAIKNRHPWLFSGAIKKISSSISVGDAVVVKNHDGRALAYGHFCGPTGLVVRILSFDPDAVFDKSFFYERFLAAKNLRNHLGLPNQATNGYRLIHGEGDGLSGLVCDIYDDVAKIELTNPGLVSALDVLRDFLVEQCGIKTIFLTQNSDEGKFLLGAIRDLYFLENGLNFFLRASQGQKTGHFLDQRENRSYMAKLAVNRRVLDSFCYSGGFSVYALHGGARSVTSVDISQPALDLCQHNVQKNYQGANHQAIKADVFSYLRQIKESDFDMIILDPPAFVKTSQKVLHAAKGYKDINLSAFKAVAKDGLVMTFSCSQHIDMDLFKKIIFAAAKDSQREIKIIRELGQGLDHPVSVFCPQSNYLKGLALYVQ
jgi:23S rRNA (cytosine1962-C5)-methyltransferase